MNSGCVDGKVLLNHTVLNTGWGVWIRFIWFVMWFSDVLLWTQQWTLQFLEWQKISWLTKKLVACQYELSFMELVGCIICISRIGTLHRIMCGAVFAEGDWGSNPSSNGPEDITFSLISVMLIHGLIVRFN